MNLHSLVFLAAFLLLAGLTFRRSSWGIPLYLLTFYANPATAWWGEGLAMTIGERWSLIASLVFLASIFFDGRGKQGRLNRSALWLLGIIVVYAINATLVHFALASEPEVSELALEKIWKEFLLLYCLLRALQDEFDLKLLLYSIILGSAYVGADVVVLGAGHFAQGRLELNLGSGDSNYAGALMCLPICLSSYFVFFGSRRQQIGAVLSSLLAVLVMLRNTSRGAFLAGVAGGTYLLIVARGRARLYLLASLAAAAVAVLAFMNPEHRDAMFARFMTIFVKEEQREASAESRVQYWRVAVEMLGDHPLGAGGEAAFRSPLGLTYLAKLGIRVPRAVHNGYLDIAASWGIQGLLAFLSAIGFSWWQVHTTIRAAGMAGTTLQPSSETASSWRC